MEVEIVEVGPSSRPLRYVPAQQRWRPTPTPLPPPPPPLPPPPAASAASSSGAGDAVAAAAAANQFDSEKLPQTLVSEIRPFLRVANQIEHESPRVAYLCRFHAFEKAHMMDPRSTGRGVRQFKTALLQRLEQDEKSTFTKRMAKSDSQEIRLFYEKKEKADERELLPVLAEVLRAVQIGTGMEKQKRIASETFADKSALFRYNILPLYPGSTKQPIMLLPEIKVAVCAVFNVRSLPFANTKDHKNQMDIFLWMQSWFGFQKGNVANQREHLILLLANMHARLNPKSSSETMMSYELYGVLSGAVSLITGEKVRPAYGGDDESFLKKVVTPIYKEIYEESLKNKNGVSDHSTWRNYDDLNEFFWLHTMLYWVIAFASNRSADCFKLGWPMRLNNDFFFTSNKNKNSRLPIVPPVQQTEQQIAQLRTSQQTDQQNTQLRTSQQTEQQNTQLRTSQQTEQQNTQLRTPNGSSSFQNMLNPEALEQTQQQITSDISQQKWLGKTNFVEVRSFWHIFRSFDRMWTLLVLGLQILIIMAWHGLESPLQLLDPIIFQDVLSIFITNAVLRVIQVILDITFSWRTKRTMRFSQKLRFAVKLSIAVAWAIILPIFYASSQNYLSCSARQPKTFLGIFCLSKYMVVVALYLTSNVIGMALFFVPAFFRDIYLENLQYVSLVVSVKSNAGAILAVWAPIILVYFMDTQIWYSVFCTIFGGMCGIIHHLGEIRTMGMVRSRFCTLPEAFNTSLVPHSMMTKKKGILPSFLEKKIFKNFGKAERHDPTKFALVWNQIINSFRSEDLISNREMDLMTMPMSLEHRSGSIRWPMFLLAKKFSEAVDMVANFTGKSTRLFCIIKKDNYMLCAINDFYELTKSILRHLVIGDVEKRVIAAIYTEIEKSIQNASLLVDFKMDHLPSLVAKFDRLAELLYTNKQELRYEVTILLQDIIDILVQDMLVDAQSVLGLINSSETLISDDDGTFEYYKPELFASISSISNIRFPFPENGPLKEQVKRLYLLLNTKEKVVEVPSNLEARRRISFFATSLFMDMPSAPKVSSMLSFSIITPYFNEEVKFSEDELHSDQDEASILSYMQKIYPDEWRNFLERLGPKVTQEEIRYWASFHGQTLSRTELYKGPAANGRQTKNMHQSLSTELDALADMKFSYVISCQKFGEQKSSGNPHAQDIIDLMTRYPALRVAYIEEKEIIVDNRPHKVYSSVLIKAENNLDQEIYRIKLPGPPLIGEGKPENQNHAIIFTRGEALQTIDMNQDNYLEEAYKMRNVLQEFVRHPRGKAPTILGLREHIFTGSVSSLAGFMSYQETSFVTIGQRFLADPLRVRFHYGHPDIFDRMFHLTRGGISKASKTINLSEDVFAGYNSILRRGHITYNEYIQVGKGRDVGLNQISKFEAKVANGNSEQTLSRDIHRLGRRFDFFRMLSCYFTTVGFYFNSLISVVGVYVFLYGQLYLVLSGLQRALLIEAETQNMKSLETALVSQSFLQLGLLTGLPMVMELGLEKGFRVALSDFILMQLQLASVFFTFSLGTKAHYYGRTILHGGAKYRPTGRKFVAFHASFTENYQLYSRSHFVKGFELIVEDWADWTIWMRNQGGIGVQPEKSWESWWNAENAHLRHSVLSSRILEVLLSLRFFIYQYGLVYHLKISQDNKNFLVYLLSWVVIIAIVGLVKPSFELKAPAYLQAYQIIVQVLRPKIEYYAIWEPIQVIAHAYDYGMGSLLFFPIAALAWMPVISAIQTRVLFNRAFSRQLQIQPFIAGKTKRR
uniref:1,3-beta-glucan synthase n=1 Tax=Oryza meridionalis TaxID=40149 RepID=A0A0E0CII2_9ORYZ